jgi:uncharacterized protein with GYD domain
MEHYLLHLSYTTAGWDHILSTTPNFNQRMDPVRNLIAQLGGSFAAFHFHDRPPFDRDPARRHIVYDKFAMFGAHDVMAVLAMPDKNAAQAFTLALQKQPGIEYVHLSSMMPFEDAVTTSVNTSNAAIAATGYAGPGSPSP